MAQQRNDDIRPGKAGNLSPELDTSPDALQDESDVERVEGLAARAEDEENLEESELSEKLDELAATTDEEIDALRVNLLQDDELSSTRDGSGRIVDDIAEERIARFTEADPREDNIGAISVAPGRDDTSRILRRHRANTTVAGSEAVVEGNLDEPMDESVEDRKVDEGTGG
jgi:hypothetical protein